MKKNYESSEESQANENECSIENEYVNENAYSIEIEQDDETENIDEIDCDNLEKYRRKEVNKREYYAAAFVLDILIRKTDPQNHLKQLEILKLLHEYPYEINIERKKLGRIVHGLADSGIGVLYSKHEGVWYDETERW